MKETLNTYLTARRTVGLVFSLLLFVFLVILAVNIETLALQKGWHTILVDIWQPPLEEEAPMALTTQYLLPQWYWLLGAFLLGATTFFWFTESIPFWRNIFRRLGGLAWTAWTFLIAKRENKTVSVSVDRNDLYDEPPTIFEQRYFGGDVRRVKHFPIRVESNLHVRFPTILVRNLEDRDPKNLTSHIPYELPLSRNSSDDLNPDTPKRYEFISWQEGAPIGHVLFHKKGSDPIPLFAEPVKDLLDSHKYQESMIFRIDCISDGEVIGTGRINVSMDTNGVLSIGNVHDLTDTAR